MAIFATALDHLERFSESWTAQMWISPRKNPAISARKSLNCQRAAEPWGPKDHHGPMDHTIPHHFLDINSPKYWFWSCLISLYLRLLGKVLDAFGASEVSGAEHVPIMNAVLFHVPMLANQHQGRWSTRFQSPGSSPWSSSRLTPGDAFGLDSGHLRLCHVAIGCVTFGNQEVLAHFKALKNGCTREEWQLYIWVFCLPFLMKTLIQFPSF
jgi:hypothetical protein